MSDGDLHICGACKAQFSDLDDFIVHKKQRCLLHGIIPNIQTSDYLNDDACLTDSEMRIDDDTSHREDENADHQRLMLNDALDSTHDSLLAASGEEDKQGLIDGYAAIEQVINSSGTLRSLQEAHGLLKIQHPLPAPPDMSGNFQQLLAVQQLLNQQSQDTMQLQQIQSSQQQQLGASLFGQGEPAGSLVLTSNGLSGLNSLGGLDFSNILLTFASSDLVESTPPRNDSLTNSLGQLTTDSSGNYSIGSLRFAIEPGGNLVLISTDVPLQEGDPANTDNQCLVPGDSRPTVASSEPSKKI